MQTKPKANSIVTHTLAGDTLTFTVKDAGTLTLDMTRIHADLMRYAAIHGLIQRVSDGAAISRNPETGLPATPADKHARMARIIAHLESGTAEWKMQATAAPRGPSEADVVEALGRATRMDGERMLAKWMTKEGCDRAEALRQVQGAASVKKALLEIAAERIRPSFDGDERLAALVEGDDA